jgi:hypothetical protein
MSHTPDAPGRWRPIPANLAKLLDVLGQDPELLSAALNLSPHDREQLRLARQQALIDQMAVEHFAGMSRRKQGIMIKQALTRASATATASTPLARLARAVLAVSRKPLSAKHLARLLTKP